MTFGASCGGLLRGTDDLIVFVVYSGAMKVIWASSVCPCEAPVIMSRQEMNSKHAFDMLMQDLNAQIAQATQDRDEKAETKAKKLQAKADAQGDLNDTTTTRDADVKYLADLTATCEQKASDFESRQQLRADEIVVSVLRTTFLKTN